MRPFTRKNHIEPKGIEKLLKKDPEKNFLIDINNMLADKTLDEITPGQLSYFAERYKIKNPSEKFGVELAQMLGEFLSEHLGNQLSSTNDFQSAKTMQRILGISDLDFEKEYRPKAIEIFKKRVSDDLYLTKKYNDQDSQFEQLRKQLGLTDHENNQILDEVRQSIIQPFANKIIADARISPQEKEAFDQLCKDLSAVASFSDDSKKALDLYANLWQIENGSLPIYETDIFLQKGETCHYKGSVKLFEIRTKTTGVKYGGMSTRLRITKSLYYRAGNIKTARQTQDVMTLIDTGNIYVTNKRILFNGGKGNKVIRYSQIIDLTPYTDGVGIIKETGGETTFQLSDADGETLIATITRIINEQQ